MGIDYLVYQLLSLGSAESSAYYPIYSFLIHTTVYVTITAVFIILFKLIFKNKLKAKYHFLIWLVLLIRLLVPVLPTSPVSVFNSAIPAEKDSRQSAFRSYTVLEEENEKTWSYDTGEYPKIERIPKDEYYDKYKSQKVKPQKDVETEPLDADKFITFAWFGGSAGLLGYFIVVLALYKRRLNKSSKNSDDISLEILESCKAKLKIKRKVKLYFADTTPALTGIFRPKIFIPEGLTAEETESTLLHELSHMKHFDVLWSAVAAVILCLNWFNPIIWISFFMFKRDIEVYCDERTLRYAEDKKSYAELLLKTASNHKGGFVLGTTSLFRGKSEIKRRIRYMAKFKKPTAITLCIAVVIAAAVALVCLTNADMMPSESRANTLVEIRMNTGADVYYNFAVHTDKTYYVRKLSDINNNDDDAENKDFKNIRLSDEQYNSVKALVDSVNTVVPQSDYGGGSDGFGTTYEARLYDGNYSGIIVFGDSVRSGYDDILIELIKLLNKKAPDYYNGEVTPAYDDNEFFDDKDKNKNISYSYNKYTKTLTFSGKGKMEDYEYMPYWYDVMDIDKVVVNEGITRICRDAFSAGIDGNSGEPRYDTQYTKGIELPDSLTEIGDEAFSYCYALKELKLPKNTKKIGEAAFMECKKLEKITIPNGVTKISNRLFCVCEKLTEVELGDNTKVIGEDAFSDTAIKSIKLPETLEKIGDMAFYNCMNLNEIEIPYNVKSIGRHAFKKFEKRASDFTIKGYSGTAAESYAKKNGHNFVSLGTYKGNKDLVLNTAVDYGNSKLYDKAEIDGAVDIIKERFKTFTAGSGKLQKLSYKGDDYSKAQLGYCNKHRGKNEPEFTECMVFDSLFHTEKDAGGSWNADEDYTWSWYLAKQPNGSLKLITYGY